MAETTRIRVKEKDGQTVYPASPDGANVYGYKAGNTYDVPADLGATFIREGWATESNAKTAASHPEGYDLPETEEQVRARLADAAGLQPPGLSAIAAAAPGAVEEQIARNPHLLRDETGQESLAIARSVDAGDARVIQGTSNPQVVGEVTQDGALPEYRDTSVTPTAGLHYPPAATPGGVGADVDGDGVGDDGRSQPDLPSTRTDDTAPGADVDGDGKGDDGASTADVDGRPELPAANASRADLDDTAVRLGIENPAALPNKDAVRAEIEKALGS